MSECNDLESTSETVPRALFPMVTGLQLVHCFRKTASSATKHLSIRLEETITLYFNP